jgi:hypothetical protein
LIFMSTSKLFNPNLLWHNEMYIDEMEFSNVESQFFS